MIPALACVAGGKRGSVDRLFLEVAARLTAQGLTLAGAIQVNRGTGTDAHCDMDIRVLPDGATYRISQKLGRGSTGCRLDPDALERAVSEATRKWDQARPDLLVINKFGKMEGEGRGFRQLIAQAVADGVPVLVGVNQTNLDALESFLGMKAPLVSAEVPAILGWVAGQRATV